MKRHSHLAEARIIIPQGVNIWPHELKTAQALVAAGHTVEFIRASNRVRQTTADCLIDGELWELKAPTSGKLSSIEDNLKKASNQSGLIVFDTRRMKRIPAHAIERELVAKSHANKSVQKVILINNHGKAIDIK
ncbi:MAG: hypothetical protein FWE51_05335 [Coriobacteriia bacterium]|nr:hypothetical protein [Coriobacteriia bacterium]